MVLVFLWICILQLHCAHAFQSTIPFSRLKASDNREISTKLQLSSSLKFAETVTGEELEIILADINQPLVVDAYATWCGPCTSLAPEFEAAAKTLEGRVRFVKFDTDEFPDISTRLNIMGLPTLLFIGFDEQTESVGPSATLIQRVEGAIDKQSIVAFCEHSFFGGPVPSGF